MTIRISVIGIDGSGKSTVATALADLASAELGITAASVGDDVRVKNPNEDLLLPGFAPDGESGSARLTRFARRLAKFCARHSRRLYPLFKLAHLALQEQTVKHIQRLYRPDIIFCDANFFLTTTGRGVNYYQQPVALGEPHELIENFYRALTQPTAAVSPSVSGGLGKMARRLRWVNNTLKLDLFRLPDGLIFLDVSPQVALERRTASGQRLDLHENLRDMTQAQMMYRTAAEFFRRTRGVAQTHVIDANDLSLGETLRAAMEFVRGLLIEKRAAEETHDRLGTTSTNLSEKSTLLKRIFTFRYIFRYALPNLLRGSANEATFPFSSLGKLFLREGYSAGVMKAIYLRDTQRYGWLDRIFLDYPLHRAVYHRLKILQPLVEKEIRTRLMNLADGETLRIFTAPSGYAFDLLPPLLRIAQIDPGLAQRVRLIASDLDPDGRMEAEIAAQARELGIPFEFVRGDLTACETQERLARGAPYDLVLFVGLSSWISKPHLVHHLRFIRERLLAREGTLVSDCFTPQAFALSGKFAGYRANYFAPNDYSNLLAFCNFDPRQIFWMSGAENINHVCLV